MLYLQYVNATLKIEILSFIVKLSRVKYGRPREEVEKGMVWGSNLEKEGQPKQRRLFS